MIAQAIKAFFTGAPTTVKRPESWAYQLQDIDPEVIHRKEADLVVVDSADNDGVHWTDVQIKRMQTSATGIRRRVVAYVSIGEAEDYRPYFKQVRGEAYVDEENPDWEGNFKVKYWDARWQKIVFRTVLDIAAQGYDGVYLDIIDGYEYYLERDVPDAEEKMADFVIAISEIVKALHPKFWIVPQNGEALLRHKHYRDAIDAIGKEDLFYGAEGDTKENSAGERTLATWYLKDFLDAGKPVFSVEYGLTPDLALKAMKRHIHIGNVPLITERKLNVV